MDNGTKLALDGVVIFVVSQGTGLPVFVVGGPWFGHSYLTQLHSELAKHFHVIAHDPRGSGQSSALTQDQITLAGHLRDLEGLRQALKVDRVNLLGHSMGALLALFYASTYPESMASLVLLTPGPPFDRELRKTLSRAFASGHLPQERARLKELESSSAFAARDAETLEEYFKVLYSPFFLDRANIPRLQFAFTATTAQYALQAEGRLLEEILDRDPMQVASQVHCPTSVVHAGRDLIPEESSAQLAGAIPGAEYLRLSGVGHFGYLEDTAKSTPPIIDFFTRMAR